MKTTKRILSMLLALVMVFTMLPLQAMATEPEPETSVDTGDLTVEGTNGFGTLLSQEIQESQEESTEAVEDYEAGYSVIDLTFEGSLATVEYSSLEEAILVVAVYSEDGLQMIASGSVQVSPEEDLTTVTIEGDMPEFFLASAYLMDTYDLSPLCAAYDTPMYTREMQELLASTVDDYDPEKVLNLDEDETTNFAVYADSTIVIEGGEGVNSVTLVDDENSTYVIADADETVTGLTAGDVFVYPYAENGMLIVKVSSIEINGSTVIIYGDQDLEMDEVFQIAKIEGVSDTSEVTVDDSTADEGITYIGLSQKENGDVSPNAWEGGGSANLHHEFKTEIKGDESYNGTSASYAVSGLLRIELDVSIKYYISLKSQYIEFKATPKLTYSATINTSLTIAKKLGSLGVSPVPGVYVGFEPELQLKFDDELGFEASYSAVLGFKFDSTGFHNLSKWPKADLKIKAKGDIFFGVDFKPEIVILNKKVARIELTALIGLQLDATASGKIYEIYHEDEECYHQCNECMGIDIAFKGELSGTVQFLGKDWLKLTVNFAKISIPAGELYWCMDKDELGVGPCPYYVYRLTATVKNQDGDPLSGADVIANHKDIEESWQNSTNDKGVAILYLPKGTYSIRASYGERFVNSSVEIEDACKKALVIKEEEEDTEEEGENPLGQLLRLLLQDRIVIDDSTDNENAYLNNRYELFDISMNWVEAKAYCEELGGHLVTITSEQEHQVIMQLLSGGTKNCYWIGLTRETPAKPWKWVTGEMVTFLNWSNGEPNNDLNAGENYVHLFGSRYANAGQWNDTLIAGSAPTHAFNHINNIGIICEFEATSEQAPTLDAVYGGDYSTEVTNTYTLKTASFSDLVPGQQYVLLAMVSINVENPLSADNLLCIDQAEALEDGTLVFRYVQRTPTDISYVVACGASNKDLNDAEITFPEMEADGEVQAVNPTVVYDGKTLTEGQDYTIVGTVSFTEPGTYTCYIRGVRNYTGLVECVYTVDAPPAEIAAGWSGATQWTLTDDGVLTVYGEGNMKNYGYAGGQPWLDYADQITAVVIEEGVTAVGSGAFMNLTTLKSVTLPESLTRMGEAAFYGCAALKEIYIPNSVYTVFDYTFKGCTSLESVRLSKQLIKVGQGAFENCTSLDYIFIPTNVNIIGSWSFKGCTALLEADMQWADATEIREGAFKNCSALTKIILPSSIQALGDSCFYGIGATTFTVPVTVTAVGPWCFARAKLTEIVFEGDAPAIGEGAFNKITLIAYYPSDNTTWTSDVMQNYGGRISWTAN